MYSIKENTQNTYIIKKSKFITKLYKVNDINEINDILEQTKKEYKSATHVCYSYICNNNIKCSDDNEPNGTAGLPIYNVLKMNNLDYILCIVIRYFGGIKLGAGGLTRAYSTATIEALNKTDIIKLQQGLELEIEFNYNNLKQIDYLLKEAIIINKLYNNNIIYTIYITNNHYKLIKNELNQLVLNVTKKRNILL